MLKRRLVLVTAYWINSQLCNPEAPRQGCAAQRLRPPPNHKPAKAPRGLPAPGCGWHHALETVYFPFLAGGGVAPLPVGGWGVPLSLALAAAAAAAASALARSLAPAAARCNAAASSGVKVRSSDSRAARSGALPQSTPWLASHSAMICWRLLAGAEALDALPEAATAPAACALALAVAFSADRFRPGALGGGGALIGTNTSLAPSTAHGFSE